jgi:glycosyltransferase involved in cell wall biosynthesis
MPEFPFFSVVIPTYNRASKVVRTVESVLAQTYQDFEILVVDDGSTDNTAEVLKPFQPRIRYYRTANQGASTARNEGISHATGRYIAFLDADDRWLPEMLEKSAQTIQSHPGAGLFYTGACYIDEVGRVLWEVPPRPARMSTYHNLLRANFLVCSGTIVKKELLAAELFDPRLVNCADWDLWIRLARQAPIQPIPGTWVLYEYAAKGKLTSDIYRWIEYHDRVIEKAFQADATLKLAEKRQIVSSVAYLKGRICLEAGSDRDAQGWFVDSLHSTPLRWKAWIYLILLTLPTLRRHLPARIKTALRLPEVHHGTPGKV